MTDQELEAALEARQGAVAIRSQLEAEIEQHSEAIKEALTERGQKRIAIGRWVPQLVEQERKTIDAKKLLSAGVSIEQIDKGTTVTQVRSLRVNLRGPGDGA